MNICPNCSEKIADMKSRCPKCGIIPETSVSPVLIALLAVVLLVIIAVAGLFIF